MTDVSFVPADVGVASAAIVLPLQIQVQANAGVVAPVPLIANNWGGYELGNTRLDRITRFEMSPGMNQGGPEGMSANMQRFYQGNAEETEKSINGIAATITVLQRALEDVAVAQAKAEEATIAAAVANYEAALITSYTGPSSVLTANQDGTVDIASHTRIYGDGREVSVDGTTLSGYAAGDIVRPYYSDSEHLGGAVVWQGSISGVLSQANGVHLVGYGIIPAASSPPSPGNPSYPPGYDIP